MSDCTHEILTSRALIAQRCAKCGLLRPLEPATFQGGGTLYIEDGRIVAR